MNNYINELVLKSDKYAVVIAVLFVIFSFVSFVLIHISKKINQK